MENMGSTIMALILAGTLFAGIALTQDQPQAGKVLGFTFESLRVSSLERSIHYYKMLGFTAEGDTNPPWTRDEAANRLYSTPGAMSRTVAMKIPSTVSGQPFTLYLREYKDIDIGSRKDFPARAPSAAHIGVMVPDADSLWTQLKSAGLLRALSWDSKLVRMPGQTSGGIAYVMDPDGFAIEIIGVGRKQDHPTLHHAGLTVLNSAKSMGFYGKLLGAKFPDALPQWLSGDMYDAAVGGHGYVIRLINGAFPEGAAPSKTMPFELIEYQNPMRKDVPDYRYSDIAVNCPGFKVSGLDALYANLKSAGIPVWSSGGIVQKKDGTRSVVVRDPDVGAFVELFE
jgi:catechol 2,3-dioxygenase-like lactoylglutathione lyase family enzyme